MVHGDHLLYYTYMHGYYQLRDYKFEFYIVLRGINFDGRVRWINCMCLHTIRPQEVPRYKVYQTKRYLSP